MDRQAIKYRVNKYGQVVLTALSLVVVGAFGAWWFYPGHIPSNFSGAGMILDIILFLLVSYVIWHPIVMEVLSWAISSHIKDIKNQKAAVGLKVAFITTFVPKNEPISMLEKCLPSIVAVDYPHDTWLLDEGDSVEAKELCQRLGVRHFSRLGESKYQTPQGKYTRTKGGNHNAWYDAYGDDYDVVAQIDPDFVPVKSFLTKTLGYFKDAKVAFVGTPQIYGNTDKSLIALGAAEQQYNFYGSILRGLCGMGMPLLIGANHIVRVAALEDVDHYSAHITEDLLTGMKLHARGWKSVYVSEALAVGEAPVSWESYFNQQMRWAYGCIDILFHHSPRLYSKMSLRQAIYYFFLQQHYFSGIAQVLSVVLLSLYFLLGVRVANVDLIQFSIAYSLVVLVCWLMSLWLQRYNVYRPEEGKLFIVGKIISVAVWPIWFLAFVSVLINKRLSYKVTPKGEQDGGGKTSLLPFAPHIAFGLISLAGLASSLVTHRNNKLMILWALSCTVLMFSAPLFQNVTTFVSKTARKAHFLLKAVFNQVDILDFVSSKNVVQDCLFLLVAVWASCALYVGKLGFYSDDWSFLGNFILSSDQSLVGLTRTATTANTFMRPVQNFYDALLYLIFGLSPLGYQLVNTAVFLGVVVLFYLVLRKLQLSRVMAVTIPLVFAFLPNYSTDRFWYAAFQVNLSIFLYLLSLYAGLTAISLVGLRSAVWKLLSLVSLTIAALAYELVIPLVFLSVLLFAQSLRKIRNGVFIILNLVVLAYLVIFKALTTTRFGSFNYPQDVIYLLTSIFHANFGIYLFNFLTILQKVLTATFDPAVLAVSVAVYLGIFLYLFAISSDGETRLPKFKSMLGLFAAGVVVFFFGYAIFLTNNKVGFSPTGIDNRVAIVASMGIAIMITSGVGGITRLVLPQKLAKGIYSITIALVCSIGLILINTLASFWAQAYLQEKTVLTDIWSHVPGFTKNSTLILDGVCPYVGPSVVFESQWDLQGALQTMYPEPSLKADVVTPRLSVKPDGIYTQIYTFKAHYPYKNLTIYNYKTKQKYKINNMQAANAYFGEFNPNKDSGCPPAVAGNGVNVF